MNHDCRRKYTRPVYIFPKFLTISGDEEALKDPFDALIRARDAGGLVYPSEFMKTVCLVAEETFAMKTDYKPRRDVTVDYLIEAVLKRESFLSSVLNEIPECERDHFTHRIDDDRVEIICRLVLRKFFNSRTKRACRVFLENQKGLSKQNKCQRNGIYSESRAILVQGNSLPDEAVKEVKGKSASRKRKASDSKVKQQTSCYSTGKPDENGLPPAKMPRKRRAVKKLTLINLLPFWQTQKLCNLDRLLCK